MNKEVFLLQLKQKLTVLSSEEREAALTYYEEYFNDAGIENEQSVINELGSVEKVANGILKENNYQLQDNNLKNDKYNDKNNEVNNNSNVNYVIIALLIIFYAILAPVIIPIIFAIIGVIVGFSFAGIGIVIAGFAVTIMGIVSMFLSPINGLLVLGAGLILLSVGVLLTTFMTNFCIIGIPAIVRAFIKICKFPFQKGGINI